MPYLARSADVERGIPPQSYLDHVFHVLVRGRCYLRKVLHYSHDWDAAATLRILELAAEYHDLGKLNEENQEVLLGVRKAVRLPVPHADAGVASFTNLAEDLCEFYSALLIYAHHRGLPNVPDICNRGLRNTSIEQQVNQEMPELLERHNEDVRPAIIPKAPPKTMPPLLPPDLRLLFSCLTHADHGDAARASNEGPKRSMPPKLRPVERLDALRRYVGKISADGDKTERNQMRAEFFEACSNGIIESAITICDAPVGTGKTTSVMSYLLNMAAKRGLRRIFVILPFTNIITQSVQTYRRALVLEGENAEEVVAEIHHRADFQDKASRSLTALWDAPIVVTTAVAFFETLASASPSTLRRLQNLPGGAIFLDEAHAMLPARLLPLAWQWIRHSISWSCHWVLASGSLSRFWELEEFGALREPLSNVCGTDLQRQLAKFERNRIRHRYKPECLSLVDFVKWLATLDGPIIVVLNTVHTAAFAARAAETFFGAGNVLHLSTALTPADRDVTLRQIESRLKDEKDHNWCLVATSCVEAGVDLSFRTGVRECASLLSVLQLAGRVNRNSEHDSSDVWTIFLNSNDDAITANPSLFCSARILRQYFEGGTVISPDLCTDAIRREIREQQLVSSSLLEKEGRCAFETVEKDFVVIEDDSQLTLIDPALVSRVRNYESVSWQEIQKHSVRLRKTISSKLAIEEAARYPGLLLWPEGARYTPFLGYMSTVIDLADFDKDAGAII